MSQSDENDPSQGKQFATVYYHYVENRPKDIFKLVEKIKLKI